jgi:hypothetical protein
LLHELSPADRHGCVSQALEAEHRLNPLLHSTLILLAQSVDSSLRRRVAIERDLFRRTIFCNGSGKEPFNCGNRSRRATPSLLELRDGALHPSPESCMSDIDAAALGHDLNQISIAEFVSEIPSDTEDDDRAITVAALK